MIRKIIGAIILGLLVTSCSQNKSVELTQHLTSANYNGVTKTLDLSNKNLSGFVTLKGHLNGAVVNTIDLSNNNIQDIDLRHLDTGVWIDLSDNQFMFSSDILLPDTVRHLDLSNNQLETLDTIDKYKKIKTIDISNNMLGDSNIEILQALPKLQYADVSGNIISPDFLNKLDAFNAGYLLNNEPVY